MLNIKKKLAFNTVVYTPVVYEGPQFYLSDMESVVFKG